MIAAGVIAISSCTKDALTESGSTEGNGAYTLTAFLPETTKAYVDNEGISILWHENDSISVFGNSNYKYKLKSGAGTTKGVFEAADPQSIDAGFAFGNHQVVYPYLTDTHSLDIWQGEGFVCHVVPSVQTAPAGSFDPQAAIMIGLSDGSTEGQINLHHAVGYLKVPAPETITNLKAIVITATGKPLTGQRKFSVTDGSIIDWDNADDGAYVTIKPEGGSFTANANYYAAVLPGTYDGGMIINYVYAGADASSMVIKTKTSSSTLTVAAGHVIPITVDLASGVADINAYRMQTDGAFWAEKNIGANSSTDAGGYYGWGGTVSQNTSSYYSGTIGGTDPKLDLNHDTATQLWGGAWRMPTSTELKIFSGYQGGDSNITKTWNDTNKGFECSSSTTSKSVFFPAAGYYDSSSSSLTNKDTCGYYWQSCAGEQNSPGVNGPEAMEMCHDETNGDDFSPSSSGYLRSNCLSVRAVLNTDALGL